MWYFDKEKDMKQIYKKHKHCTYKRIMNNKKFEISKFILKLLG